jgi:hypothetical protein
MEVADISSVKFVPHGNTGKNIGKQYAKKFKGVEKEGEKTCSKCWESKSLDEFGVNNSRLDGKLSYCKKCINMYERNSYTIDIGKTLKEIGMKGKIIDGKRKCNSCNKWKLVNGFTNCSNNICGLDSRCIVCNKAYYYKENRRIKLICMLGYGGCCQCCGDSRIEMLTIEHIRGKGHILIYDTTITLMKKLIELGFPEGYTCLCWGCNQLTKHGKPCVHSKEWPGYYNKNILPYNYPRQKELDELEEKYYNMEGKNDYKNKGGTRDRPC